MPKGQKGWLSDMVESIGYFAGFLCGVLVGVLVIFLLIKWARTDRSSKCRFDERQELVRGRGFKYAFFAMVLYDAVIIMLDVIMEKLFMTMSVGMFMGMIIGVVVYVCYCIWNEGYFALNENPKRFKWLFGFLAVWNLVMAFTIERKDFIKDGVLQLESTNFFCGIALLIVFLTICVKEFSKKREEE